MGRYFVVSVLSTSVCRVSTSVDLCRDTPLDSLTCDALGTCRDSVETLSMTIVDLCRTSVGLLSRFSVNLSNRGSSWVVPSDPPTYQHLTLHFPSSQTRPRRPNHTPAPAQCPGALRKHPNPPHLCSCIMRVSNPSLHVFRHLLIHIPPPATTRRRP